MSESAHKISSKSRSLHRNESVGAWASSNKRSNRTARAWSRQEKGVTRSGIGEFDITTRSRHCRSEGTTEAARACPVEEAAMTGEGRGPAVKDIRHSRLDEVEKIDERRAESDTPASKPIWTRDEFGIWRLVLPVSGFPTKKNNVELHRCERMLNIDGLFQEDNE